MTKTDCYLVQYYKNLGPDSQSTCADVSRDTPRKCKYAPSYLCAMLTNRDTPKNRVYPTDVTCLRRRIVGAYLRWTHLALPLFCYSNMQMREIRRFTNVRALDAVCVKSYVRLKVMPHKGGVTQQQTCKGLHQGTQAGVFYVVYVGRVSSWA